MRLTRHPHPRAAISHFPVLSALLFSLVMACQTSTAQPGMVPLQQAPDALLCQARKAICYSGFRQGQHPDRGDGAVNPSADEVLEDLQILSRDDNFRLIRLYDARVNSETVLQLIKAHQLNIRVLLGAWLDAEVNNPNCPWLPQPYSDDLLAANKVKNGQEVDRAIRLAKEYADIVVAVAVGNEALVSWNDHMVPVDSVIDYVRRVKQAISQPVTVCDNYDWWVKEGVHLAREVDFVSVHIYPIWEGKDVDEALSFGIDNLKAVRRALPDSRLVITEAGWATVASEFGPRTAKRNRSAITASCSTGPVKGTSPPSFSRPSTRAGKGTRTTRMERKSTGESLRNSVFPSWSCAMSIRISCRRIPSRVLHDGAGVIIDPCAANTTWLVCVSGTSRVSSLAVGPWAAQGSIVQRP